MGIEQCHVTVSVLDKVYVLTCRLGCNGFTFTLRDSPSRSPLDGDITELMRETLDGDLISAAAANK